MRICETKGGTEKMAPTSATSRRMSILVVCPGCRKSFKVSDRFAGKSGPCPSCKATIQVPTKSEEVKVHAPTAFADGGRSTTGQLLTKPIARKETRLGPVMAVAIGAGERAETVYALLEHLAADGGARIEQPGPPASATFCRM